MAIDFLQDILTGYLSVLQHYGQTGVFLLMALENSILPAIPTELIVPPATYLARIADRSGWHAPVAVVIAGTLGAYVGATMLYWASRYVGRRLVLRFGKLLFLSEARLRQAEQWVQQYGTNGILIARLLPAARHASIVIAGITGMPFLPFSLMTLLGAFIWCLALTLFGICMAPEIGILVRSHGVVAPAAYQRAFATLSVASIVFAIITGVVSFLVSRNSRQ